MELLKGETAMSAPSDTASATGAELQPEAGSAGTEIIESHGIFVPTTQTVEAVRAAIEANIERANKNWRQP